MSLYSILMQRSTIKNFFLFHVLQYVFLLDVKRSLRLDSKPTKNPIKEKREACMDFSVVLSVLYTVREEMENVAKVLCR